jgi:hypothetical protein
VLQEDHPTELLDCRKITWRGNTLPWKKEVMACQGSLLRREVSSEDDNRNHFMLSNV